MLIVCVFARRTNMGFLSNLSKPIPMFQVLHPRVSHNHHRILGTPPFGGRTASAHRHSSPPLPCPQKKAKKPTDEPTETNTDQPAKETVAVVTEKEAAVVKEEEVAVVIEGAAAVEKVAEKAVAEKALVQEKAVVAQAVVEQVAEAPRNLLSPVVGWVSGIFSPQSIPASTPAAAQQVQAAEFSTMVSHQVPCFVEAGEVVEAGKEAEAALPGFLSMPPVRAPTLVDSVVGWVSGVFTAKCATQPTPAAHDCPLASLSAALTTPRLPRASRRPTPLRTSRVSPWRMPWQGEAACLLPRVGPPNQDRVRGVTAPPRHRARQARARHEGGGGDDKGSHAGQGRGGGREGGRGCGRDGDAGCGARPRCALVYGGGGGRRDGVVHQRGRGWGRG
jgi:hypothetical protein